jgi:hypothetical protein
MHWLTHAIVVFIRGVALLQGSPDTLVGLQKDLRHDQRTIEELRKTGESPITAKQEIKVGTVVMN